MPGNGNRGETIMSSMLATRRRISNEMPRRSPILHWLAMLAAIASLGIAIAWLAGENLEHSAEWLWIDIGLSAFFVVEFITRSGFRWNPVGYSMSHFFDFVAMAPVLMMVDRGIPYQFIWMWVILAARFIRVIDRTLGDGFVKRNALALFEGFEEEITDRVLGRILERTQQDLERGHFAYRVGQALDSNRYPVLQRIRSTHPRKGIMGKVLSFVGINRAMEKVEEGTYNSVVEILYSPEMDQMIRDVIDSTFSSLRKELGEKSWKKRVGIEPDNLLTPTRDD